MTNLDAALAYVARGWHVFPLIPRDKRPATPNGHHDATVDPDRVRSWWSTKPDAGIGISLEPSGLVVLDVDIKDDDYRSALAELDDDLPETLIALTGSGGLHAVYTRPDGLVPARKIRFKPGLDLLGKGYIVAAPSIHPSGEPYRWDNPGTPIVPLPDVLRIVGRDERPQEAPTSDPRPTYPPAPETLLEHVRRTLASHGPAVEGQGGDNHTFLAAIVACHDYALRYEDAWPLLQEWNQTCQPPWDEGELRTKMENALAYNEGPYGEKRRTWEAFHPYMQPLPPPEPPKPGLWLVDVIPSIMEEAMRPAVKTPWGTLDNALGGGFRSSTITLINAGTGKGKTAFATMLGAHHAKTAPVVYYLGELTPPQLAARIVAQRLDKSWGVVLNGFVSEKDMRAAVEGVRIVIVPRQARPVEAIAKQLDDLGDDAKGAMVVVDYVQLLADIGKDMRLSTMQAIRDVQNLTEVADVVTVVLSQTSRFNAGMLAEGDRSAEDYVGTGAETQALEAAAANVLALAFKSEEGATVHDVVCMVAKARFRGPSKIGFKFHGASGRWEESVVRDEPLLDDRIVGYVRAANAQGSYPSKSSVKSAVGVTSNNGFEKIMRRLLDAGRLQIVFRHPELCTEFKGGHHLALGETERSLPTPPRGERELYALPSGEVV